MTDASRQEIAADYVVVGAGSAGCVLADRLSADGRSRVLVLEAGGDDRPLRERSQFMSNMNIHVPVGFTTLLGNAQVDWRYQSEPDPHIHGRAINFTRGKVLGGSSSINGMLYVRGQPQDFDGWRQMGCTGWGWDDVLPYFNKSERDVGVGRGSPSRGTSGPLRVTDTPVDHVVTNAIVEAWQQAGVPYNADPNGGGDQEGVSYLQMTAKHGLRQSTAVAYLHPAMKRANLEVRTRAMSSRILFEGRRAVGVEFRQGGHTYVARAAREVVLAAGVIASPQLLQLSGVGPGEVLAGCGVPVTVENPHVGRNMEDHYAAMVRCRMKPGSPSFNAMSRGIGLLGQMLKFALTRQGLLALGGSHATAFVKSRPDLVTPDMQFFMSPGTVDFEQLAKKGQMVMESQPGFTIGGYPMRPESRGYVAIKSPDPEAHPKIVANYLSDPLDQQITVAALKLARKVVAQPALAPYFNGELTPGEAVTTDEGLLEFARAAGSTGYHPVGTCRMGERSDSVVDSELRVRGVERLRVVDASVMPKMVSGNTNAATIMIAEKASDLLRHTA